MKPWVPVSWVNILMSNSALLIQSVRLAWLGFSSAMQFQGSITNPLDAPYDLHPDGVKDVLQVAFLLGIDDEKYWETHQLVWRSSVRLMRSR